MILAFLFELPVWRCRRHGAASCSRCPPKPPYGAAPGPEGPPPIPSGALPMADSLGAVSTDCAEIDSDICYIAAHVRTLMRCRPRVPLHRHSVVRRFGTMRKFEVCFFAAVCFLLQLHDCMQREMQRRAGRRRQIHDICINRPQNGLCRHRPNHRAALAANKPFDDRTEPVRKIAAQARDSQNAEGQ